MGGNKPLPGRRLMGMGTRGAVALAVLLASLAVPTAAHASCVGLPSFQRSVDDAEVIFVGTVTALTNEDRWATVAVEDVWKGENIPAVLEVRAGPADPPGPMHAASSVDRTFRDGARYIFFPYGHPPRFRDSSCSATQIYTDRLAGFRPSGAQPPTSTASPVPTGAGDTGERAEDRFDPANLIIPGAVAVLLLLATLTIARRAGRS